MAQHSLDHYFLKVVKQHREKDHEQSLDFSNFLPDYPIAGRTGRARQAFGLTFPGSSHLMFSIPLAANGTLSLFGNALLAHAQISSYGQ